jgi:hypothetical protein
MNMIIGSLVYVRNDRSQNECGTLWDALPLRTPSMVVVGNFNFYSCVVAQLVDWRRVSLDATGIQHGTGNKVLVMRLNFRGDVDQ